MIYLFISFLTIIDQLTKFLTVKFIVNASNIVVIPKILELTYVENTGAAFSMLEGKIFFFVLASIFTVVTALYLHHTNKIKHITGKIAMIFIVSGGVGNLIDRIRLGFVVDMIELKFINFAIFNVADIFITIGGFFMVIYILFFYDNANTK